MDTQESFISAAGRFRFDNTYARLPDHFHARVNPTSVTSPRLVKVNADLAQYLGLDPTMLAGPQGVDILAGNYVAAGSEPLAMAYAGHQFGHFVPQLGDGRANLLGEVIAVDGVRYDIQLKGSGPTPFSRRGDGRAALGPVLREYILSEAMTTLGVPSTRALAAVTTGEQVLRETTQPGAVFARVATSHLRVGTFQFFASRGDLECLRRLAQYAISRHYPEAAESNRPIRTLLDGVVTRQALLVARWMLLGFIHGVMNTDNTSISGETIDYGPCAFMEAYDAAKVYSSIDRQGRYAYGNQPHAIYWNLARLAEALLPLLGQEEGDDEKAMESAHEALAAFGPQFEAARNKGFRHKLGLREAREGDVALAEDLLSCMAEGHADFTLTFRRLCTAAGEPKDDADVSALFANPDRYCAWARRWRSRLAEEPSVVGGPSALMRSVNPMFIPRNHLVEEALNAAVTRQDFAPFETLLEVTSKPYDDQPGRERYLKPAEPNERVLQTFCGT